MTEFIVLNIATPLFLFLLALLFKKYRPKNINGLYGYRTVRSMRSQEAWDFAQEYSSVLMVKMFAGYFITQMVITVLSILFLSDYRNAISLIGILAIVPLLIVLIVKTEKELKRKFSD